MSYLAETISTLPGNSLKKREPVYVLFQEEKIEKVLHIQRCEKCKYHFANDGTFYGKCLKFAKTDYWQTGNHSLSFEDRRLIDLVGCASWDADT